MNRFFKSFGYAWKGVKSVFRTEQNMKIHTAVTVFMLIVSFIFKISTTEWIAVVICIGLVVSAEMINTAFETLVDIVSPNREATAGKIKDITAGAVLVAALISVDVGIIIFLPKLLPLFTG